ncbi:hypothetical protein BGY98DRAFT_921139 [Russula aff. rugulosa BPL654]|nr:hypothetical protein BGY98DRAFT_921139 [Russula aff. rugulosa BPL654]
MTSPQYDDVRSPTIQSPIALRDLAADPARPPLLSIRNAVPILPTPGSVSKRHPTYEVLTLRFYMVTLGSLLLGTVGIGLEIAAAVSKDKNGFHVPQKNVFSFASIEFLTSFFPALLFVPLALMVKAFDFAIRIWNPYLLLSKGNAPANETLLIDYVSWSNPLVLYNAMRFKHRFILVSSATAMTALLFQPLAGSIFSVKQLPTASPSTAQSIRAIGLSPEINDLTAFVSSAGVSKFVLVFNNIGDPSFIHGGWAIADCHSCLTVLIAVPTNSYLNGTMGVNTTGIQTNVNCALPNQLSVTPSSNLTNTSILSATSIDGCSMQLTLNLSDSSDLYGVVNVPSCGSTSTNVAFQPVFFWFLQQSPNNSAGVFCQPRIQLFDVTANAFLNNNSLYNVSIIDNYPKANNVSGPPLNSIPLIFNASPDFNIQSRANTIKTGIPNAIFRQAQQAPGGSTAVFQNPTGFLGYTQRIYTQHLSLATKSNYFIPDNRTVNAVLTQLSPRLFVEPITAHFLSALCVGISSVVLVLHFMHFKQRRDVYLAHPPGTIASSLALTAHSGFGELLLPYDNQAALAHALQSFRFCLDRRTGAIILDETSFAFAGEPPAQPTRPTRDETMMTLIKNPELADSSD